MSHPLVSVIVPAHNNAPTVAAAIASITQQTYPNVEIIVVDDNSTDGTFAAVQALQATYPSLSCYALPEDDPRRFNKRGRNVNAGYMARNYGLERAKGEWITFQDADDTSFINRIEVQYGLVQKHGLIHLMTDWEMLREAWIGKAIDADTFLRDRPDGIVGREELYRLSQEQKGVMPKLFGSFASRVPFELRRQRVLNRLFFGGFEALPGAGNSPLFHRDVFERVRFRQLEDRVWPSHPGRGADRDFNFQVIETFRNSMIVKLPLYLWRVKQENTAYAGVDLNKYIVG